MGERIFLDPGVRPGDLRAKCKGLTQVQIDRSLGAYHGKWMRVAGYVIAVTQYGKGVSVSVVESSGADAADYLWFGADHEKLELANLGDILTAVGRIEGLSASGLVFKDCELIKISTPETPIALFSDPPDFQSLLPDRAAPAAERTEDTKRPLAAAEMERFARLYLEIYAEAAVEGKALEAARTCYPDNQIGRDAFYKKFRELRGPGKRGNPAFRGK
jgi:hypothetical protein